MIRPYGYAPLEPDEPEHDYRCPVCGCDLAFDDKVYTSAGVVLGCQNCINAEDAEDIFEEE